MEPAEALAKAGGTPGKRLSIITGPEGVEQFVRYVLPFQGKELLDIITWSSRINSARRDKRGGFTNISS